MAGDPLEQHRGRVAWTATGLLALHAILAWLVRTPSFTTINDHSVYVFLARSILEGGYNEIWRIDAPYHTQYPPLFPAYLAGLIAVAGERFELMHAAVIAWSVAGLAIVFATVRRVWGPSLALVVLAVCAVNPNLLERTGEIMAEPMFIAFIGLTLWALARPVQTARTTALASAAAIAAALTRSAGIPVVVAVALHLLLERRWRAMLLHGVASAATVGAWIAWTIIAPAQVVGRSYVADAVYAGEGVTSAPPLVMVLIHRMMENVPGYVTATIPWQMPLPAIPGTAIDNAIGLGLLAVGFAAGIVPLWRRWRPAALLLGCYSAMLAVWAWKVGRFVEPIAPLLITLFLIGLVVIGDRLRGARGAFAAAAVGTVLMVGAAAPRDAAFVGRMWRCDRADPLHSEACFGVEERSFFRAMEIVRETTPDTAVVLVSKDSPFAMLSGRKVLIVSAAVAQDSANFFPYLEANGVQRLVLTHISFVDIPLSERLLQECRRLTLVTAVPPLSSIYTWVAAADAAKDDQGPACRELDRYRRTATRLE